jgi:hypothetical protein
MEINKKVITKNNEIWIDDERILIVKPIPNVDLDLEEVKLCFEIYESLGVGPNNKLLQIIDTRDGSMSSDARAYAAEHIKNYFIASAIISDSLAVRIIVNFFNTFYKPNVPFKMFSNEVEAREWLKTFKK